MRTGGSSKGERGGSPVEIHPLRGLQTLRTGKRPAESVNQLFPLLLLNQTCQTIVSGLDRLDLIRAEAIVTQGTVGILTIPQTKGLVISQPIDDCFNLRSSDGSHLLL